MAFFNSRTVLKFAAALFFLSLGLATTSAITGKAHAQEIETVARQAILLDLDSGAILLNKNADELMHPASMTKMMTVYLVFERLKNGTLSLDDTFPVSEKAWKKGGSKMFVEVGSRVKVEDLLQGIIVQSGNDATIVVAEGIAGTEEAFAKEMTAKAKELGMTHTTFKNASGWPDPEHLTTAHDLSVLASAIIRNFPEYYHYFSEKVFTYSGITQHNRNPLLYVDDSVDGLKTGHTEESGYGLTASAKRDGRRLLLVINGLPTEKSRETESERILDWGFREWKTYDLFAANDKVEDAPVWLGDQGTVPLVLDAPVKVTLRRKDRDDMKVQVRYDGPIKAPVEQGEAVGTLTVSAPGIEPRVVALRAGETVNKLGPLGRLSAALGYLLWGETGD